MKFQRLVLISGVLFLSQTFAQSQIDIASKTEEARLGGKFTGSPITLKLKDADVHDVLRLIGETSGFNIVVHPDVKGKLSLSLEQVPWDQALDVVLTSLKLAAERSDSVLKVMPRDLFISNKRQEMEEKNLAITAEPRVTRIFPISYADLTEIADIVRIFSTSQDGGSGGNASSTIIIDKNTQSLIVRNTADNVEKIKKLIQLLDVQTPQVLIEAKVVEANEAFSRTIDGSLGLGGTQLAFGFNGQQALFGTADIADTAGSGVAAGNTFMTLGGKLIGLNSSLRMAESENKVKVVSSPRTVVLSGKSASITQTKTTAVRLVTPATSTTPATTQLVTVNANTKLNVTPRVTNDGSVFMKLDLNRDILRIDDGNPVAEPRQMNTEVIVESGNTLVIGGVLNIDENSAASGVPFLRKIPLIGALFGKEVDAKTKSELMFFITPRILNQKKAALSDDDMKKL
jgi:type IV pilus assembly protein PilQ